MHEFWQKFVTSFQPVWECPFSRGILFGAAAVLLVLLFWQILKLIFFLCFGPRRCRYLLVSKEGGGEISVSSDAVSDAVRVQLESVKGIDVMRISLFRRGRGYRLELRCRYHGGPDIPGVPAIVDRLRPLLTERLKELFGIQNLSRIKFRVDSYDGPAAPMPQGPDVELAGTKIAGENKGI